MADMEPRSYRGLQGQEGILSKADGSLFKPAINAAEKILKAGNVKKVKVKMKAAVKVSTSSGKRPAGGGVSKIG